MTVTMTNGRKLHALMFPYPLQGHITPCLNLAIKLASKGLAVTFVNFEHVHHMFSKANNKAPTEFNLFSDTNLQVSYAVIDDGLPLEFDRVAYKQEFYDHILRNFPEIVEAFVRRIMSSDPLSTYFLIVDTLFSWQAAVAENLNIVHVSFWTQTAMVFSLIFHLELLKEKGHYPLKDGIEEDIDYIPGIHSLSTKDFMPYLKESQFGNISTKVVSGACNAAKRADFVLHCAVQELEPSTLSALNRYQPHYPVGPLTSYKNVAANNSLWARSDCTLWLDSKPTGSVLYVSFGSLVQASKQVIEEIAYGLILSQVNFIWVARAGIMANLFPAEIEDEVRDKGLIVQWCNQTSVLSNPAVGAFLTHCGFNSVVESIWCGTPMLCYPLDFDQPINRKLVVEDWKIGLSLSERLAVNRNDVAAKIKAMMAEDTSKVFKHQIMNIKDKLCSAIEAGGSSERNMDQFIHDLEEKVHHSG